MGECVPLFDADRRSLRAELRVLLGAARSRLANAAPNSPDPVSPADAALALLGVREALAVAGRLEALEPPSGADVVAAVMAERVRREGVVAADTLDRLRAASGLLARVSEMLSWRAALEGRGIGVGAALDEARRMLDETMRELEGERR